MKDLNLFSIKKFSFFSKVVLLWNGIYVCVNTLIFMLSKNDFPMTLFIQGISELAKQKLKFIRS